jgi:hypothetical protein
MRREVPIMVRGIASQLEMTANNYERLGVEVDVLKADMQDVKGSLNTLYGKIDSSVGDLGREMRRAMDALGSQITERAKTPWAVIWAGLGVMFVLIGFIANQAISPINHELSLLRADVVPRSEHIAKDEARLARLGYMQTQLDKLFERDRDAISKANERLEIELRELRRDLRTK